MIEAVYQHSTFACNMCVSGVNICVCMSVMSLCVQVCVFVCLCVCVCAFSFYHFVCFAACIFYVYIEVKYVYIMHALNALVIIISIIIPIIITFIVIVIIVVCIDTMSCHDLLIVLYYGCVLCYCSRQTAVECRDIYVDSCTTAMCCAVANGGDGRGV